jgi:deoxycytidylate deaminase
LITDYSALYLLGILDSVQALSRQVGASILSENGEVLATGCNDVPSPGGGLYCSEDAEKSSQCVHLGEGRCSNDYYKLKLKEEVENILLELHLPSDKVTDLSDELYLNTRLRDLLEFSRSVHAEMDAITSVARLGGKSIQDSILYSTTFPCHNCARHIIASGIKRVVYIEPYEKSLAVDLHSDAINLEPDEATESSIKVTFIHFEGVAPNRFTQFFRSSGKRKDKLGMAINVPTRESSKVSPQYLDKYFSLESKVVDHMEKLNIDPTVLIN